jgi:hypothetical protein
MERTGKGTKFTIDRKIFSSDIWFSSPWKLKIWVYLIGNANHSPGMFMGEIIERGQLIRSYRTIQKDCGYKIGFRMKYPALDTVRRCCEEFMKEGRTEQRTIHCGTLFTICNYNDLQPFNGNGTEQREQELSNSDRTVTVHNKKNKNEKKEKNIEILISSLGIETEWNEFKKHRIIKKAPMTEHAQSLILKKLQKFKTEGMDPVELINKTIEHGWQDINPEWIYKTSSIKTPAAMNPFGTCTKCKRTNIDLTTKGLCFQCQKEAVNA